MDKPARSTDDRHAALLNAVQWQFPLSEEPYADLAEILETSEEEVLAQLEVAKREGVLRQLSAIFDTRALGYRSSLVAAKVDPERIDAVAERLNDHPGISHNYRRNHEFNLWYTIAVPPGSSFDDHIEALHQISEAETTRTLETLKLFKIGVKLDMTGERKSTDKEEVLPHERPDRSGKSRPPDLNDDDLTAIRLLQSDLPLTPNPFATLGASAGVSASELVAAAMDFRERKLMRRFAAVMNHRKAGFKANAMGVWKVPADSVDEIGPLMAGFAAVSHCYRRPTYEDWPYSVFTMVHGRTTEEINEAIAAISEESGIDDYALLWSTKEYKKVRVRYFTPDWDAWESENLG